MLGSIWRLLIKKDILQNIKFDINLKYCEDLFLVLQLFMSNAKMAYVDENLYYYVNNPMSVTKKFDKNTTKCFSDAMLKCISILKGHVDDELIASIEYDIYNMSVRQAIAINNKNTLLDYKKYNTRQNYKAFLKYHKTWGVRIKAFLSRYRLLFLYKMLLKLKQK